MGSRKETEQLITPPNARLRGHYYTERIHPKRRVSQSRYLSLSFDFTVDDCNDHSHPEDDQGSHLISK